MYSTDCAPHFETKWRIILYLVEQVASWVMPMMRRTSLSSIPRSVEDEEESVVGGLGLIFLLDAVVGAEVDGLVVVDEAFVVVVRPAGGSSSFLILFSPEFFAFYPLYKIIIFVVLDDYLYLCTHKSIKLCHSLHGNIRFHKATTG